MHSQLCEFFLAKYVDTRLSTQGITDYGLTSRTCPVTREIGEKKTRHREYSSGSGASAILAKLLWLQ